MNRVAIFVSNDLANDQRIHRIAQALVKAEWQLELFGILKPTSLPFSSDDYLSHRLTITPSRGFLFYVVLNLKFFIRALTCKANVLVSVDLDTLPAIRLASWLNHKQLVWDCHEIFTEMPELTSRPQIQKIWKFIERTSVPGLKNVIAVNEGVARHLSTQCKVTSQIIYNYPVTTPDLYSVVQKFDSRIIFFQGVLNQGRGLDVLIYAMLDLPSEYTLEIAGDGPQWSYIKRIVQEKDLTARVSLLGMLSPQDLKKKTQSVCLGISLLESRHENSRISLANKNLDYIMAGLPAIAMDFPEYKNINDRWPVALLIQEAEVRTVRSAILKVISDFSLYLKMHAACLDARKVLCWEQESDKVLSFFQALK